MNRPIQWIVFYDFNVFVAPVLLETGEDPFGYHPGFGCCLELYNPELDFMSPTEDELKLPIEQADDKFVGFVDLLGFSRRVLGEYEKSITFYQDILKFTGHIPTLRPEVKITIYSDSFLLVADSLGPLIAATQGLLMQTLLHDCLVRGGIARGEHLEVRKGENLYVVSEALVKAAAIEKSIKHPCVALHHEVEVPDDWWLGYQRNLDRGLLYFGGLRIVNPCNIGWGQSAGMRVIHMLEEAPQHRDKFDWFLELHQAIFSPVPMIPPRLIVEKK